MNKHTPGPWHVQENTVYALNELDEKSNIFFASVYSGFDNEGQRLSGDICYANAKLMAAAPDLLAALEYALPSLGFEEADKARAAIARARGET